MHQVCCYKLENNNNNSNNSDDKNITQNLLPNNVGSLVFTPILLKNISKFFSFASVPSECYVGKHLTNI